MLMLRRRRKHRLLLVRRRGRCQRARRQKGPNQAVATLLPDKQPLAVKLEARDARGSA